MNATFKFNSEKDALGAIVIPFNIDYYHKAPKPKLSDFGYRPFDVVYMQPRTKGAEGSACGCYGVYYPAKSVVTYRPGCLVKNGEVTTGSFRENYFEQIYLSKPNTIGSYSNDFVKLLPADTKNGKDLFLWIARVNGKIRACLGERGTKPKYVLHEVFIAYVPPVPKWGKTMPLTPPKMPEQYFRGQYRFISDGSCRFFSFEPLAFNALQKGVPLAADGDGADVVYEEYCYALPECPYVNVSGRTVEITGWTDPEKTHAAADATYIRIYGDYHATLEEMSERSGFDKKFPGTQVFDYLNHVSTVAEPYWM